MQGRVVLGARNPSKLGSDLSFGPFWGPRVGVWWLRFRDIWGVYAAASGHSLFTQEVCAV